MDSMSMPEPAPTPGPPRRARPGLRVVAGVLGVVSLVGIAVATVFVRLSFGPIDLAPFAPTVREALERALPPGHAVHVTDLKIEWTEDGPSVRVRDVAIRGADGALVMSAPAADIGLSMPGLLVGRVEPSTLVVREPRLGLAIAANGRISPAESPGFAEDGDTVSLLQALDPATFGGVGGSAPAGLAAGDDRSLRRLSLRGARLAIFDERTSRRRVVAPFDVTFARDGGALAAQVSSAGPLGRWALDARVENGDGGRVLRLAASGVSLSALASEEFARAAGPATLDLALSGPIDDGGGVGRLQGTASIGGFRFTLEGVTTDIPPQRYDLAIEPANRRFEILPGPMRKPGIQGRFALQANWPAPGDPTGLTRLSARLDEIAFDEGRRRHPGLARVEIRAGFEARERRLWIDRVTAGPESGRPLFEATGSLGLFGESPEVRLQAVGRALPHAMLRDVWPSFVIPSLRQWLLENVLAGTVDEAEVEMNVPSGWMARMLPLRNEMFRGRYVMSGVTLRATPEQPPIDGVAGVVTAIGSSSRTEGRGGQARYAGGVLTLGQTSYVCEDAHLPAAACQLATTVNGPLPVLVDAADRQGAGILRTSQLEARALSGEGTAQLRVAVPVGPGTRPGDLTVATEVELRAVTIRGALDGRDFERGSLRVRSDGRGFEAQGTGQIAGAPVRLQGRSDGRRTTLRAELDTSDEVRARLGYDLSEFVSGPIQVRALREIVGNETTERYEADLAQTRIAIAPLAFEKARGVPASIAFSARELPRGGTQLDDLVFQGRGFALRGRMRLDEDGVPSLIEITEGRLRPDDAFSARYERDGDRQQVRVTGRALDARPFLARVFSDVDVTAPATDGDRGRRLDLSLRLDRVVGANGQSIGDARLEMTRMGQQMTAFTLGGSLGGATRVTGQIMPDQGRPTLMIQTTDGGALLRFADLYANMVGGRLTLTQSLSDPTARSSDGLLFVQDFRLRDDPMFERLFGATSEIDTRPGARPGRLVEQTQIDRLRVVFARGGGVTEVREGSMRNAQLGITFEGRVDFRRNRLDLKGTAIPAFALNNLLARLPILGIFLGGPDGGLLGVTYQLQGPIARPEIAINPVSAIAPGFLRNIFQFPDPPGTQR